MNSVLCNVLIVLILLRLFEMQSPGGEQCTSVVCKTFVAFTKHKIDDFMKFPVCNEEIKTVR